MITALIQVALLLLLFTLGFVTPLPLPGEEGIAVSFGTERGGRNAPIPVEMVAQQPAQRRVVSQAEQKSPDQVLTQDFEEAPEIRVPKPERKKKTASEDKKTQTKPTPVETPPTPTPPERTVDQASLFTGAKPTPQRDGMGTGGEQGNQGTYQGTTIGAGVGQGQGQGTGGSGSGQGLGGSGVSYSLGNRVALRLPSPEYPTQKSGRVVVKVWVDRNGKVTKAEPGEKGSTTFDAALMSAAKNAAMKASFDVSSDAPSVQVGTITYVFKLKQ